MQNSSQQPGPVGPSGQPGASGPFGQPVPRGPFGQPGVPEPARVSGALVFVLVIVAVHALGTAAGGWAVLDENYNKEEHGQDLLMPMGLAWFVAVFCWAMAALQAACVVLARRRRPWIRVVLAVCLAFLACSMFLAFMGSLAAGAPSLAAILVLGVDTAALWVVLGETGRRWFSARGPATPAAHRG
ncbi:collagen-like triple helix repeat-containing protein [Streptomyces lycii]|uniref:Collagen-like protein n=1 Tax=Streptomyces lycii TaxID=2654337 RepID=A0ABQ7FPH5_9ACTN|nr:collagen-like protein [Streptomyces lycii]KAF4410270.1 collagen-like protein [Streptomyces lycii]